MFSMLIVSVDGMCAIDFRESGRDALGFGFSRLAMACSFILLQKGFLSVGTEGRAECNECSVLDYKKQA